MFGSSSKKPAVDKLLILDEETGATPLRTLLREAVLEKHDKLQFKAEDEEIKTITGTGGTDLTALLDHPTKFLPTQYDSILATIIPAAAAVDADEEEHDVIDIMEESRVEMSFLEPDFSFEEVKSFQQAYADRTVGRTSFLSACQRKPTYDSQIRGAILHVMEHAPNGMRPAGFRERKGDKAQRLKEKADAESSHMPTAARRSDQCSEKGQLEAAIRFAVFPAACMVCMP